MEISIKNRTMQSASILIILMPEKLRIKHPTVIRKSFVQKIGDEPVSMVFNIWQHGLNVHFSLTSIPSQIGCSIRMRIKVVAQPIMEMDLMNKSHLPSYSMSLVLIFFERNFVAKKPEFQIIRKDSFRYRNNMKLFHCSI